MQKVQLHDMKHSYQSQFNALLYQASCRQLYSSHTTLSLRMVATFVQNTCEIEPSVGLS